MFADYHVHSHFSEDTDFPMELEIQKAIHIPVRPFYVYIPGGWEMQE